MADYRQRSITEEDLAVPARPATQEMPAYMTLAAQYGIEDEMDVGGNANDQTMDQEYQLYVTAPHSPKNVNIIKFWEVSGDLDVVEPHDWLKLADQWAYFPYALSNGHGLPAYSGIICAMRAHFFIECRNRCQKMKLN